MRLKTIIATSLALTAALAAAAPASATPCWRKVVNDWYGNGRVDGHYPIHCYSEAIAKLPEDSKQYSSAPQDIRRDMLLAIRGDRPGGGPGDLGGGGTSPTPTGFTGTTALGTGTSAGHRNKDQGFFGNVFDAFGPKNASSIPLPLIILAAVALLLLAAGGASFAARRIQSRKVQLARSNPPRPPRP